MKKSSAAIAAENAKSKDRWIFGCLLLALLWLPIPWGSNTEMANAGSGMIFGGLLTAWLLLYVLKKVRPHTVWSPMTWASLGLWMLWLLWIAFQMMPLPALFLETFAPASAQLHEAAAAVIPYEGHGSISIDRGRGMSQLILSCTYFALYLLVLLVVSSKKRVSLLLWTLALSGLFQAFYGMHMTLSGMELGGLFEKKIWGRGVATGTFVNRNHYAAYLELCLAAGIGLVLADLGRWNTKSLAAAASDLIDLLFSAKFRARVMLVVMVAALILTRSRMGSVAFFVSLAGCGTLFTLLRLRKWFIPSLLLFSSLLIIDLVVVSQWFGLDEVVERLQQTDLETEGRSLLLEDLRPVVQEYLLTGAGLGNFAQAYSPHWSDDITAYYDHAHNEYAEFLIDTGLIGCTLLALLLSVHILHCVRVIARRKTALYAGAAFSALMAMTAMIVHSAAEFMLHIPAVAATLVTLMALAMSIGSESRARRRTADAKSDAEAASEEPLPQAA